MDKIIEQLKEYINKNVDDIQAGILQPADLKPDTFFQIIKDIYDSEPFCSNGLPTVPFAEHYHEALCSAINTNNRCACISLLFIVLDSVELAFRSIKYNDIQKKKLNYFLDHQKFIKYCKLYSKKIYENIPHLPGSIAFHGKGVVYTAITGGYDALNDPEFVDPDLDYICFTDSDSMQSNVWQFRKIENPDNLSNVKLARRHKILCHELLPEYDYSIWVDGKIKITGSILKYIKNYSTGSPMLCFPHFCRDCLYAEAKVCITLEKERREIVIPQLTRYQEDHYPEHNGLTDTGILVRSHHDEVLKNVLSDWWQELLNGSHRDQFSFNYVCWKNNFTYDICDLFIYDNYYFSKERTWESI